MANPNQKVQTSAIRKKIGNKVQMQDVFTKEKLSECSKIIEKAHKGFFDDVFDILELITNNFRIMFAKPEQAQTMALKITENSFAMKGKLDAIDYGLGMKIVKSLHNFAKEDNNPQQHVVIYSKHIEALKTVIKHKLKGDGGKAGEEMIKALSALIKKTA